MTPTERAQRVKAIGRELGFDDVGITPASRLPDGTFYREWLASGRAGGMRYLHRNVRVREDPGLLLSGSRSIICAALQYRREDPTPADPPTRSLSPPGAPLQGEPSAAVRESGTVPEAQGRVHGADTEGPGLFRAPQPPAWGKVARYARGTDYHTVIRRMLDRWIERLHAALPEVFEARAFVDTGPLLERQIAARAGLGWIGKNTLLLHPRRGSYFFLAEIVTTLELTPDQPITDHCGRCTRCLDACPTQALTAPYQMDASRCISYLTIENRAEIPEELHPSLGHWVYGCDVCQEVCPYNGKAPLATHPELSAAVTPAYVDLHWLDQLRSGDYRRLTKNSAAGRASRVMWRRNAQIALKNAVRAERAAPANAPLARP